VAAAFRNRGWTTMNDSRWLGAVLGAALITAVPLGPMTALAQTPTQPMQPEPPPMQSMQPETVTVPVERPGTGARVGASVLNVVYVPGKAIVCGVGTVVAGGFMLLTFGSAYREAISFFNEGCGGAWVITPEQVAAAPKKVQL